MDGITALSTTPLRWAGYASARLFALLFVYVAILAARGMLGASVSGAALVGALVLLLFAVQMAALAILGEYVGRMFNEAKRRPLYLVESYNDQRMAGEQPPAHQDAPEAHVTPSHLERVKNNVVRRIRRCV